MKFQFRREHSKFIRDVIGIDPAKDFSEDEQLDLEDQLTDYLQRHGINDAGDGENEVGTLCADILTFIAQNDH